MPGFREIAGNALNHFFFQRIVSPLLSLSINRKIRQFENATKSPQEVQQKLLLSILRKHQNTAFARDHHFSSIKSIDAFRNNIGVAGYETIEPYMNRVLKGETSALLADRRIHMFALTSGTTNTRKYIPVTDSYLDDYRRGWNIWGLNAFMKHDKAKFQPILQMSGDWDEYRSESGVPCGSVTGLTARMQRKVIRWLYCVPPEVSRIKDSASKYYTVMRLSIDRPVGLILAANPSTLINLAKAGDLEKESLIKDLRDGTLSKRMDIPDDVRRVLASRIKKRPEKALQLEAIINKTGSLFPKDYWSEHCLLGNWTGGSMASYLRHYPKFYGSMPVRDVGLIASEGRMTIPLEDNTPSGVLDITTHFLNLFLKKKKAHPTPPCYFPTNLLKAGITLFYSPLPMDYIATIFTMWFVAPDSIIKLPCCNSSTKVRTFLILLARKFPNIRSRDRWLKSSKNLILPLIFTAWRPFGMMSNLITAYLSNLVIFQTLMLQ